MGTIQVNPAVVWKNASWQVATKEEQAVSVAEKTSVQDVARRLNLKVGNKEVREVGHGEMPALGHPIKVGKWVLMRTTDYPKIVPQEVLDIGLIYLDNGADIKGFLIADDFRSYKLRELRRMPSRWFRNARAIDWQKVKTKIFHKASVPFSAISSTTSSFAGRMKQKVNGINWEKVGEVLGKCFKVVATAAVFAAIAVAALPLLALIAVPAALIYDPWLIAVDSENLFFVIAEWFD